MSFSWIQSKRSNKVREKNAFDLKISTEMFAQFFLSFLCS